MSNFKRKTTNGYESIPIDADKLGGMTLEQIQAIINGLVTLATKQTITGEKTFNAPANSNGSEQATVIIKTANGGQIIFGKEGPNSGSMIGLDQVAGTRRLNFRASATPGAIVWSQPESNSSLYYDVTNVYFRECTSVVFSNFVNASALGTDSSGKLKKVSLATVATSGSYSDLKNKPTIPTVPSNILKYTNYTVTVAGTKKTVSAVSPSTLYVDNGLIMGGTAAAAGLVTRGICGVTTPDSTGACTKENLYLNYDGDNNYSRKVVLGAGSAGDSIAGGATTFSAVRGDQMVNYVNSLALIKSGKQTTTSTADSGSNVYTFTDTKGNTSTFTVKNGSKGSQGIQGPVGPQGPIGPQGPRGEEGSVASITNSGSGNVVTDVSLNTSTKVITVTKNKTLATVATTGSYSDLSNKPTIPSKLSQMTNDANYLKSTDNIDAKTLESHSYSDIYNQISAKQDKLSVLGSVDQYLKTGKGGILSVSTGTFTPPSGGAPMLTVYTKTSTADEIVKEAGANAKATSDSYGLIKTGYSESNKNYAVKLDANGKAYVSVPWTSSSYTLPDATFDTTGGVKAEFGATKTGSGNWELYADIHQGNDEDYTGNTLYIRAGQFQQTSGSGSTTSNFTFKRPMNKMGGSASYVAVILGDSYGQSTSGGYMGSLAVDSSNYSGFSYRASNGEKGHVYYIAIGRW